MKVTALPGLPAASSDTQINQAHTSESPPALNPTVTEAKPVEGDLSSKYAELAKREKINRQKILVREEALKAREAKIAAQEAEYASAYVPKSKIREAFQKDPYQAMKDFDINGDQITQGLLNQPSPEQRMIEELRAEVNALKGNHDQTKKFLEDRDGHAVTAALNQIRFDVKGLVNSDTKLEIIKNSGPDAIEEVVNRYKKKFDDTGELANLDQVISEVEEEYTEAIVKMAQLPKIQALLKPAEVKAEVPTKLAPQTKTLTHSQTSSAPRALTPRERAIQLLEGTKI